MVKRFGFGREEKLKSRKQIEDLFSNGKRLSQPPFTLVYLFDTEVAAGVKAGFSVSKKNFPRAVDRNRIKRLLREAYRLQRQSLKDRVIEGGAGLTLFLIYGGKDLPVYREVAEATRKLLIKLEQKIGSK